MILQAKVTPTSITLYHIVTAKEEDPTTLFSATLALLTPRMVTTDQSLAGWTRWSSNADLR